MNIIHTLLLNSFIHLSTLKEFYWLIKNVFYELVKFIDKKDYRHYLETKEGNYHQRFISCLILLSMVAFFGGARDATGESISPLVDTSVKWHPGHYTAIMNYGKDSPTYLSKVYQELRDTPALRGLQIRYSWPELEGEEGEYDFSSIAKRLAELSPMNKRLIIVIDTKSSLGNLVRNGKPTVPLYLKSAKYEGGEFAYGGPDHFGWNVKLWNPFVRDRMIALIRALGQRFNSHPHFEGVGISDTEINDPIVPHTIRQRNDYYSNLLSLQLQMSNSFPNTLTFQFISYPRSILESFTKSLFEMGSGLGGTNVSPEYFYSLLPPSPTMPAAYFRKYSGIMPIVLNVRYSNYENTRTDHTRYEPTVNELLSYARDSLKANYIFWTRHPDYYRKVLELMNMRAQKINPSGGLDASCPGVYSTCIN